MRRQQLLTMPVLRTANKDRSAVNIFTPLKSECITSNTSGHTGKHTCTFVVQYDTLTAKHMDTTSYTNTGHDDTSYRSAFIMQAHKRWDARQHGPWVPTVISRRMAGVTEWVFSPLTSETALCVFLILSFFRWCVGKEGSPLCQATRLKSKVGSGCIWVVRDRLWERGMSTQCTNCLDPCFSMIPRTNNVSWEKQKKQQKKCATAAKSVDSLLKNTEHRTRKWQDYFFFFPLTDLHTSLPVHKQQLSKKAAECAMYYLAPLNWGNGSE